MDMSQTVRKPSVGSKAAALSIVLFWTLYYLSVSARSVVMTQRDYTEMFDNRALVTIAGMAFTWVLYLFLRRLDEKRLGLRIAAAFLASVPVAAAYATVNYYSFREFDRSEPDPPGVVGAAPSAKHEKSVGRVIADYSLHWYFFVLSWAALYLALSYAAQVRGAEREAARLRAAARDAELRALRYQVNPHFLFNTLNSISSLVMAGRASQAEAMILNLSRFFRTSLATAPTGDVPLSEEIALQRLYLDIEKVRFPDRLRVEVEVEPGLEDACVPGMILQPLVENAIKHGVSPVKRPVTVRIAASSSEPGRLRIDVEDDGGSDAGGGVGACVGLRNVSDRLRVSFGEEAGMRCGEREGGGFGVTIDMPLVRNGC